MRRIRCLTSHPLWSSGSDSHRRRTSWQRCSLLAHEGSTAHLGDEASLVANHRAAATPGSHSSSQQHSDEQHGTNGHRPGYVVLLARAFWARLRRATTGVWCDAGTASDVEAAASAEPKSVVDATDAINPSSVAAGAALSWRGDSLALGRSPAESAGARPSTHSAGPAARKALASAAPGPSEGAWSKSRASAPAQRPSSSPSAKMRAAAGRPQ